MEWSSSDDVWGKEADDGTGDAVAVLGWTDLDAGLLITLELLWNVEGVVLVHGVTYRSNWLLAGEGADCASEYGRRLLGGVRPVWAGKWIGRNAEKQGRRGKITANLPTWICQQSDQAVWETDTHQSAHVSSLTIRGW